MPPPTLLAWSALWLLAKMVACVFVLALVGRAIMDAYLERVIAGWEAILLLLATATALVIGVALAVDSPYFPIIPAGVWVTFMTIVSLDRYVKVRLRRRLLHQDVDRFQRAIRFDARNSTAYFLLGDAWRALGRPELAIQAYEGGLAISPNYPDQQHKLELLRRWVQRQNGGVLCPRCGAEKVPGYALCQECGRIFGTSEVLAHWFRLRSPRLSPAQALGIALIFFAVWASASPIIGVPKAAMLTAILAFVGLTGGVWLRDTRPQRSYGNRRR